MGKCSRESEKVEELVETDVFIQIRFFQDIYDCADRVKNPPGGDESYDRRFGPQGIDESNRYPAHKQIEAGRGPSWEALPKGIEKYRGGSRCGDHPDAYENGPAQYAAHQHKTEGGECPGDQQIDQRMVHLSRIAYFFRGRAE